MAMSTFCWLGMPQYFSFSGHKLENNISLKSIIDAELKKLMITPWISTCKLQIKKMFSMFPIYLRNKKDQVLKILNVWKIWNRNTVVPEKQHFVIFILKKYTLNYNNRWRSELLKEWKQQKHKEESVSDKNHGQTIYTYTHKKSERLNSQKKFLDFYTLRFKDREWINYVNDFI